MYAMPSTRRRYARRGGANPCASVLQGRGNVVDQDALAIGA